MTGLKSSAEEMVYIQWLPSRLSSCGMPLEKSQPQALPAQDDSQCTHGPSACTA